MSDNRKPQSQAKTPAQDLLNSFLQEHNILLGTERPQVDFTGNGQMVVSAPRIFAVYKEEVVQQKPKEELN